MDPLVGTWVLDPGSLRYESGEPGRRATYSGELDGREHPLPGGELVVVLLRDNERSLTSLLKRGGVVLGRWTRECVYRGMK